MATINNAFDATNEKGLNSKSLNGINSTENVDVAVKIKPDKPEEAEKKPQPKVGLFELFRYADKIDVLLIVIGTIAATIHGAGFPVMIIVFGDMTNSLVNIGGQITMTCMNSTSLVSGNASFTLLSEMETFAYYYLGLGAAMLVAGYFQVAFWTMAAERQTFQIRKQLMKSILRHEMAWFDTNDSGELNTRQTDDINKINAGLGNKTGIFVQWFFGGLISFVIGFVYGWKLTLVVLAVSPLLIVASGFLAKVVSSMTDRELDAYAKAGSVAEEVLSSIRTVVAFSGENKEYERYSKNLSDAKKTGIQKSWGIGAAMGFLWLSMFLSYALGFWYGSGLIREGEYTIGTMLVVFFSVIIGAFSLGNAAPGIQTLGEARGAARCVFDILDDQPIIDNFSIKGIPTMKGNRIEFRNVHFHYPSRPDVRVLRGFNLTVSKGQTVALVGPSGCGKSTTIQLLQRMYDITDGNVFIDGNDIKDFNVHLLRNSFGVVSQEPVLFSTTIAENIRYGFAQASMEDITRAAKSANAHNFIMNLPKKYETLVGERGAQLSGGQKQRIAIARALVKDPQILLLDEATSALDTESESIVQDALNKASQGRTTIVIAHRLSTIKSADMIVVLSDGAVIEKGTNDELMALKGVYHDLVKVQNISSEAEQNEDDIIVDSALERINSARTSSRLKRATSITSEMSDKTTGKTEEENIPPASMMRVMKMNKPEWPFILIGCFGSILTGAMNPLFAVIFSKIIAVFILPIDRQQEEVNLFVLLFVGLGFVAGFGNIIQVGMFGISGERLTLRLRQKTFQSMLRQEIAWFDDHKNSTGALCTRLSVDASQVQGATGARFGSFLQNLANMGTALVLGFYYGWKLTLLILAFGPFIAIGGFLEFRLMSGSVGKSNDVLEELGKVAVEAIENIRTVAVLSVEQKILDSYVGKLIAPKKKSLKMANIVGLAFSVTQSLIFFAYGACFYVGAYLISLCEMDVEGVFMVFSTIVFGAMALGQASSFAPDYSKAKASADRIFNLLDRQPIIDSYSQHGQKLSFYNSTITFKDVKFYYPTRPDVQVLSSINIEVNSGETLALVGGSGCGKSTCLQLISRFYNPDAGQLLLDGHNLNTLNISWLRKQVGIVSQEPILFDCSIRENIAYGSTTENLSMDTIIAAAKMANIHAFIDSLPEGYETQAGDKGTQLSGGQKQRIAIARALVRNPKILLLDEATSALDSESEKVVQEALDRAREGRTSIVIAHRLSTVKNANKIVVIKDGKVYESGTHNELLSNQKLYYRLVNAQQIS